MTAALVLGRRRPGRPIDEAVADVAGRLASAGWSVTSSVVDRKRELRRETKKAVAAGVDVVVAVGGDGAVLQVVQKLAGKGASSATPKSTPPDVADTPEAADNSTGTASPDAALETVTTRAALGIVPLGTGNLLAGNLGIPKSIEGAVEVLLGQRQRVIDVGEVKSGGKTTLFTVACGVGFDAEVMDATPKSRKRRLGKLAYVVSALERGRKLKNARHDITIDGVAQSGLAAQVFIANFGSMGFGMEPQLEVRPDDGLLDVIIVRAGTPIQGLLAGWEAIRQRRHGRSRGGRVFRGHARTVKVATSARRRLVETDGSVIGKTPIKVLIRPAALTVLVPPES